MPSANTFSASDPTQLGDELDRLEAVMSGRLVRPVSTDWDQARRGWNLCADLWPTAVAEVASVDDVIQVVGTARRAGLRVAPMSSGHNPAPFPKLDGVILVKTGALDDVTIDPEARTARVGGGTLWGDLIDRAAEHGLGTMAGTSRDVAVAGYVLGGGMSWFIRSHGPAADYVTAIEIVTADGSLRRVDAEHESDLFWAVLGGGGSFGVVVAIELDLLPISTVYGGRMFWPIESAPQVLHTWREWIATVPPEVNSVGRLLSFPPLEVVPEPMRGKAFAEVEVVSQLSAERTEELLAPLRALSPAMDSVTEMPVSQLFLVHGDPEGPVSGTGEGMLLSALPDAAVDAMIDAFQPPLVSFEMRHVGGSFASRKGGVVAFSDAEIAAFAAGIVMTPDDLEEASGQVRTAIDVLSTWATGRNYLNFAESPRPVDEFFGKDTMDRLRAVRTAYDPENLMLANHNIDPA
jgi:hypothetical protein